MQELLNLATVRTVVAEDLQGNIELCKDQDINLVWLCIEHGEGVCL